MKLLPEWEGFSKVILDNNQLINLEASNTFYRRLLSAMLKSMYQMNMYSTRDYKINKEKYNSIYLLCTEPKI